MRLRSLFLLSWTTCQAFLTQDRIYHGMSPLSVVTDNWDKEDQLPLSTTADASAAKGNPFETWFINLNKSKDHQKQESKIIIDDEDALAMEGPWAAYLDVESSRVYYYNHHNRVSQWETPTTTFPTVTPRPLIINDAWMTFFDPVSKLLYYWDRQARASTWTKPDNVSLSKVRMTRRMHQRRIAGILPSPLRRMWDALANPFQAKRTLQLETKLLEGVEIEEEALDFGRFITGFVRGFFG